MRNFIIIIAIVFLNCSKKDCKNPVRETESIEISKVIIEFVRQNDTIHLDVPFSSTLKKFNITDLQTTQKEVQPKIVTITADPNREILVEKLLHAEIKGKQFFKKSDSLNFIKQNCKAIFTLPKNILQSEKLIKLDIKKPNNPEYYEITFPIFSSDNKKAYIEIDTFTKEYCFGSSFYLEKIENKWKIIDQQGTWDF